MATKPTDTPRWATSVGRTVEPPENGTLTTSKDAGWLNGTRPPARMMNWVLNLTYQWLLWLEDINNQPFNSGGVGAWTKTHEFTPATTNTHGAIFQGNGTGLGLATYGGSNDGSGLHAEGGANGYGILAVGNGANAAGSFINTADGPGIVVEGGPDLASDGGTFTGGAGGLGGNGVTCTGAGAGSGVKGTGGGSNGVGVKGAGAGSGAGVDGTGGPTNAIGVKGTGGGTTGSGVQGTGGSTGIGVLGIGGSGSGAGVRGVGTGSSASGGTFLGGNLGDGIVCQGGATNGAGIHAIGTGGDVAIRVHTGNVGFTGTQPVKTEDTGHDNYLSATQVCKAWAQIHIEGFDTVLVFQDGVNFSSIAIAAGDTDLVFTFARPMATANYTINTNTAIAWDSCSIVSKSTTGFTLKVYTDVDGVGPVLYTYNGAANTVDLDLSVTVMGRQ